MRKGCHFAVVKMVPLANKLSAPGGRFPNKLNSTCKRHVPAVSFPDTSGWYRVRWTDYLQHSSRARAWKSGHGTPYNMTRAYHANRLLV